MPIDASNHTAGARFQLSTPTRIAAGSESKEILFGRFPHRWNQQGILLLIA
jgi:hypothetical protein